MSEKKEREEALGLLDYSQVEGECVQGLLYEVKGGQGVAAQLNGNA